MASSTVRLEMNGRLAEVILDSPERGNGINLETAQALRDVSAQIVAGRADIGAVLIRATGKHFCVGGDLREFADAGTEMGPHLGRVAGTAHFAIETLAGLDVPVVSAVQGAIAGAGVGLALTADIVVVGESTKLRLAYTAIDLSPDCGSSWLLTRRIGPMRAVDLGLTNRLLTAPELLEWGIASRVTADDTLLDDARAIAAQLAEGPTAAFSATKSLMTAAPHRSLHDHLAAELDSIATLGGTPAAQAAVAKFVKR